MHNNKTIISLFCLLIIAIFPLANSLLPEKKRKILFNKYFGPIFEKKIKNFGSVKASNNFYPFNYDINKIQEIIQENKFPKSYDFIESEKPIVNIKDQVACGCCWSMASTTSLAYRFNKKGVKVDLSPQNGLSCYLRNGCDGNDDLDAWLHLVRNGTVTEQCIEFSSGNQIVEQCRTSCKNPEIKYEKYYAKNVYTTKEKISETNFYNVVMLIMDELVRNGPITASIDADDDFGDWFSYSGQEKCHNEVYSHTVQEGYNLELNHLITIVGYGVIDSKYYWLVQNSWGKYCDNGFVKIEFGQIGIESEISFAEPFIEKNNNINVNLNNFDDECTLNIEIKENLNEWKNPLLVQFKHKKIEKYANYICDVNSYFGLKCSVEKKNIGREQVQGDYKFNEYKALGPYGLENNFILDENLKKTEFHFYGFKPIYTLSDDSLNYFVSREGSKISFNAFVVEGVKELSPIYPNVNKKKSLSQCNSDIFTFNGNEVEIGNCELKKKKLIILKI